MGEFAPYLMVLIPLFHACRNVDHAGGEEVGYLVGEGVFFAVRYHGSRNIEVGKRTFIESVVADMFGFCSQIYFRELPAALENARRNQLDACPEMYFLYLAVHEGALT